MYLPLNKAKVLKNKPSLYFNWQSHYLQPSKYSLYPVSPDFYPEAGSTLSGSFRFLVVVRNFQLANLKYFYAYQGAFWCEQYSISVPPYLQL